MSSWMSSTSILRPSLPSWLEETCQRLTDNDESMKTVDLAHPRIDDVFARIVAKALDDNHTVTAFILSCYSIVDDGAYAIGSALGRNNSVHKLKLRDLRSREVITFLQALQENTSIEELSLRHAQVNLLGAQQIAALLRSHSKLKEIRITDSQLQSGSVLEICQGLKESKSAKGFHLVNCEFGVEGAAKLGQSLMGTKSLNELYLSENILGDEGVSVLVQGLLKNGSVRSLDLRANSISENCALSLQGLLVSSRFLEALTLSDNELGDLGTRAISRGLQHASCKLIKLDLSGNDIGNVGAMSVATMLRLNSTMTELHLANNSIDDEGAAAIALSLTVNTSLRILSMRRNNIHNNGAFAFARCLPKMHVLKELLLTRNNIEPSGAKALLDGLRFNVELQYLSIEDRFLDDTSREIAHWLSLNKAGRRILRQNNIMSSLWPYFYGGINRDPDVLFYFLRQTVQHQSIETLIPTLV